LSEAEQKLYDLVVRRFMAVFFPSAEYQVTTRISTVAAHNFKTVGKVLVKPGWLAIYGKEAAEEVEDAKDGDKGQNLVPVQAGEKVGVESVDAKGLKTRPPARYSEATLLGAMEGAGKLVDDDELREAMQEKGLGTPATRAATIEGLINEKYMLREGRELIPTAKAFQLMTLLRGLGVEELSRPELTGEWEYKLAQMEQGKLSRTEFMQGIAAMTEHIVKKAKEYDRDTVPGDYATLHARCPNCAGVVRENYRRYTCTGSDGASEGCGFSFGKSPAGRTFEPAEVEQFLNAKKIGPLDGFRSKAGWPFVAEMALKYSEEDKNWKDVTEYFPGFKRNLAPIYKQLNLILTDLQKSNPEIRERVLSYAISFVEDRAAFRPSEANSETFGVILRPGRLEEFNVFLFETLLEHLKTEKNCQLLRQMYCTLLTLKQRKMI
jgi:DNA topoisomerase-3